MTSRIDLAPGVAAPEEALFVQFSRGSGPGGQNVNKLNTKAELWLTVAKITGMTPRALDRLRKLAGARLTDRDEIHLSSDSSRTQVGNRKLVFERLRELIVAAQVQPKPRRPTKPSRRAKQRRLDSKRIRSEIKASRSNRDA
jgi:ribosome-associated protein